MGGFQASSLLLLLLLLLVLLLLVLFSIFVFFYVILYYFIEIWTSCRGCARAPVSPGPRVSRPLDFQRALYYRGPTEKFFTIYYGGSDRIILYYWGLTEEFFTIGVWQKSSLLLDAVNNTKSDDRK